MHIGKSQVGLTCADDRVVVHLSLMRMSHFYFLFIELFTCICSLRTKSFSELRFEPVNLNRKDIVKIFSHYHRGFPVQPLFLLLLCYKSESSYVFSLIIGFFPL